MSEQFDDLFDGGLDSKLDFLNDKKSVSADGIYRIDMSKVQDKKKGYKSVLRFLPNFTKDEKVGQSAIEKITHYVNIKDMKELSGYYDSPKNFGDKCPLTDLYYNMTNSKNAILVNKAKSLNYSKKYYSYVLVVEDEQQPELVGKIMILQYGKTIKDKILSEKNGEISDPCNVFDLASGKNFVLLVKEIDTGDDTYPDYKNSMFKPEITSVPVYNEEKRAFKNAPVITEEVNGIERRKIDPKFQGIVKTFLLNREHDLEEFEPKRLTEEEQAKITEISNFLTGKTSNSFQKASSNDFDVTSDEEFMTEDTFSTSSTSDDDEDFFSDID